MKLLKEIVWYGGDVICLRVIGIFVFYVVVCEGNIEMVKYFFE